jgi:DNA-binding response OmpR family regulator
MSAKKKIIIIDDDDDALRDTLAEQFSLHDEFAVQQMQRRPPQRASRLLKDDHADLIILDVNLPDMDGREACKIIRRNGVQGSGHHAHRARPRIPIPFWDSIRAPMTMW